MELTATTTYRKEWHFVLFLLFLCGIYTALQYKSASESTACTRVTCTIDRHTATHTRTHTQTHIHNTHAHTNTHTHIHMHSCLDICTYRQADTGNIHIHRCTHRTHTKLTDLHIQVHIMHTCSFTHTHKHTDIIHTYASTHIHTDTHTQTHTHTQTVTDRQTDTQTDRHTHASNHLQESSPSVEVSQHRVVFARHQLLREKGRQKINQGSMQHFHMDSYT